MKLQNITNKMQYTLSDKSWIHLHDVSNILEDNIYQIILDETPKEKTQIMIMGKLIDCPRYSAHYGSTGYNYSGVEHESLKEFPDWTNSLINIIKDMGYDEPETCIVNIYEDGNHYIGSHSDNEKGLDTTVPIIAFIFGTERPFRLRVKPKTKQFGEYILDGVQCECLKSFLDIHTPNSTMLIMGGDMQKEFKHEIPKSTRIKGTRLSVTFRYNLNQEYY